MAYVPTTSPNFVEPQYYSQYDDGDLALFNEALAATSEVEDTGERIQAVVDYLAVRHRLCGQAQRVLIFDAIYDGATG